jgi:hypothetical protein
MVADSDVLPIQSEPPPVGYRGPLQLQNCMIAAGSLHSVSPFICGLQMMRIRVKVAFSIPSLKLHLEPGRRSDSRANLSASRAAPRAPAVSPFGIT